MIERFSTRIGNPKVDLFDTFSDYYEDKTEVTTNGIKTKLKSFTIGDETPGTIGRDFDDDVIGRLVTGFTSGNFDNFHGSVKSLFDNLLKT